MTTPSDIPRKNAINGELAEIVGRPRSHSFFWLVVLAALGVDIATFYQVLVQVLNEPDQLVWVVVAGFAVVALTLAHYAGLHLRQTLNPRNVTGSTVWGVLAAGIWLTLGGLAFAVRYFTSLDTGASGSTFTVDGKAQALPSSGSDLTSQHYTALLFLALYAATGTITALAGYFRQEPAAWLFGRAVEKRSEAVQQHAGTNRELSRIEETLESIRRARARHEEAWGNAQAQCEAAASRLKREARLMVARNAARVAEEERAAAPGPVPGPGPATDPADPPPESDLSEPLLTEEFASEETAEPDPGSVPGPGPGDGSPSDLKSEFGLGPEFESEPPTTPAPGSEATPGAAAPGAAPGAPAPGESEPAAPGPTRSEAPGHEPGFLPTVHLPARLELEPAAPEAPETGPSDPEPPPPAP